MKKIVSILALVFTLLTSQNVSAQVMFDTGMPSKLIQAGVRIGFNSSNLSTNYHDIQPSLEWNHTQWKNGFNAGAVFDINFRNYFAIQPGIFFKSRNNDFRYLYMENGSPVAVEGHWGGNYIEIPILASLRLGVAELAQLQLDFGPYFATGFGGKSKAKVYSSSNTITDMKNDYFGDKGLLNRSDWGFKMGVGFLLMHHYYIGAHYNAGCKNVLKDVPNSTKEAKGHNKMWSFTLGYNF